MNKSRKIYLGVMILAAGALILDKTVLRPSATKPQNTQAHVSIPARPNTAPALNNSVEPVPTPKSHGAIEPKITPNSKTFDQTPLKVQNAVSKLVELFTGDPSPLNLPNKKRNLFSASDDFMSAIRLAPTNLPEPNYLPEEKTKGPAIPLKLTGIVIGPYQRSAQDLSKQSRSDAALAGQDKSPRGTVGYHAPG